MVKIIWNINKVIGDLYPRCRHKDSFFCPTKNAAGEATVCCPLDGIQEPAVTEGPAVEDFGKIFVTIETILNIQQNIVMYLYFTTLFFSHLIQNLFVNKNNQKLNLCATTTLDLAGSWSWLKGNRFSSVYY